MGEITLLRPLGPPASVLETLDELTENIKSGNIVAVAVATLDRDGQGGVAHSSTNQVLAMIGVVEFLKRQLMEAAH